jgi:hypothetical protein
MSASQEPRPSRGTIVRDLIVFQLKLWVEGFKDIVLMPLSLGAAVLDLLWPHRSGQPTLYRVMRLGDRFERWVNLYGPVDRPPHADAPPGDRRSTPHGTAPPSSAGGDQAPDGEGRG